MIRFNADREWIADLEFIFKNGYRSAPRGMKIYEAISFKSIVSMNCPIIQNKHRRLGYKFMAAEAAWILNGQQDVASIAPFSKEISSFSDDGEVFYGAYGPRIRGQIDNVIKSLVKDRDTRQAVLTIWRPNPRPSKDIPCTVALQWLIRNNKLHCVATMRSSDMWLGHPYDIFNFSCVSFFILLSLAEEGIEGITLGELHLTAGSKHIYEKNINDVGFILEDFYNTGLNTPEPKNIFDLSKYSPDSFIDAMWDIAHTDKGALTLME